MLVDLPQGFYTSLEEINHGEYLRVLKKLDIDGYPIPVRVGKGLYLTHLNFNHDLGELVVTEHPFEPWFDRRRSLTSDEQITALKDSFGTDHPRDFGVCDYPEQVVECWPEIESCDKPV